MHPQSTNKRTKPGICEICGRGFLAFRSSQARFCSKHCSGIGRNGDRMDRFRSRFDSPIVIRTAECWLWMRGIARDGYGHYSDYPAHRLAWELASGEQIPEGLIILHTCDVRNCVRNDENGIYLVGGKELPRWGHLALGTYKDNLVDAAEKGHCADGAYRRVALKPETIARGEAHHRALLTNAQAQEIRQRYRAGGIIKRELAAEYGVSTAAIKTLLAGKTYQV